MSNEYRGEEIVSELILNPPGVKGAGKIKQNQLVDVRCCGCDSIQTIGYKSHRYNRIKSQDSCYKCHKCKSGDNITYYNNQSLGLSLEQRLGSDKAKDVKSKLREYALENSIGDRLPSFLGKSWEDSFGKEKSEIMKANHRLNCKLVPKFGPDNHQWGKPAHKLSGSGTKGYYNGIYFRSLMEASFIINFLEKKDLVFENGELKKYAIPYTFQDRPRNYFCDFVVGNTFYEVKPKALHNTAQNRAKWESAKEWCLRSGYNFEIYSEYDFPLLTQFEIDFLIESGKLKLI